MKLDSRLLTLLAAACTVCAAGASAQGAAPASATMEIKVRHSITGADLGNSAAVDITDQQGRTSHAAGRRDLALQRYFQLPPGRKSVRVSAPGHRDAQVNFDFQPGERLPVKVLLDPEILPPEMQPDVIKANIQSGKAMLHGHVVDEDSGKPLKGATVRLEGARLETVTDDKGYFLMQVPVPPTARQPNEIPTSGNLLVNAKGYKDFRIAGTLLPEDATHFAIELEAGSGSMQRDDTHKLVQAAREAALRGR